MRWRGRKRDEATIDDSLLRFFAAHQGVANHRDWTWVLDERHPAGHRVVETYRDLADPAGVAAYAAVAREEDGSVVFVCVAEHPSGPNGHWYRGVYTWLEWSRHGPTDPIRSQAEWRNEVAKKFDLIASSQHLATPRVRARENAAFIAFAGQGIFPHIDSWIVQTTIGDENVPCAGGRIEIWTGAVGGPPFTYPHLAAGFSADERLLGIVAAEAMPDIHDVIYLGMFYDGGHENFGEGEWLDPQTFTRAAVARLSPMLLADADRRRAE